MSEKNRKQPDSIDLELTRIYFGGTADGPPPGKTGRRTGQDHRPEPSGKEAGKTKPHKPGPAKTRPAGSSHFRSILFAGGTLILLAGFAVTGMRFLGQKRIVFRMAIKDVVTPKETVYRYYDVNGKVQSADLSGGRTLYDFENTEDSWNIPGWAQEKADHVAISSQAVRGIASKGNGSLEISAEFPGGTWSAALVEISHFLDLDEYALISADVFLPSAAPRDLRGRLILTTGDDWRFVEMSRAKELVPGEWTTIAASVADGSTDWKRTEVDGSFRGDIRKIAVRVESNRKPAYKGPFYIDNITVYRPQE